MIGLIKKITKPVSVSGHEHEVNGIIAEEISPYVDSVKIDALGNLIAHKKGSGDNAKKVMFAAHSDEIGFIVTFIEESGYIRFDKITSQYGKGVTKLAILYGIPLGNDIPAFLQICPPR